MSAPKWCCPGFEGRVGGTGRRGIGVVLDRRDAAPDFVLQARAVDSEFSEERIVTAFPLTLCADIVIRFCPFCGQHLSKFYGGRLEQFPEASGLLVRRHSP